ncbi:MAG: hypothetical protein GF383_16700 [Candidatus Lokiarchaeota archaeon]|nr:hypothetical protein [Candidatus Lokiarchaeota archaeon]
MSEVHNSEGLSPPGNQYHGDQQNQQQKDVTFKGEKTDLRYDPNASVKRTWVQSPVKVKMDGEKLTFGTKEVQQVQKDLNFFEKNHEAVEKATNLFPAFYGYAKNTGARNPEKLALALEHYAATNEFINNIEFEQDQ